MSAARRRPDPGRIRVYCLVDRFSATSGGRTRSSFDRAAALAATHESATLLTFNHRIAYGEIVEAWRRRLDLPPNVHVANFYEHLAAEPLHGPGGPSAEFVPAEHLTRRPGRSSWEERVEGRLLRRYVLRRDGSLNYVDEWVDGLLAAVHHNHDQAGTLRVTTRYVPGSRVGLSWEYRTPTGRHFLSRRTVERPDQRPLSQMAVHGGPLDTAGAFVAEHGLRERWVADLVGPSGPVVLLCEARGLDALAVSNSLIPPERGVAAIATIHSCHLAAPYDDPTSVTTYNHGALAHADLFAGVVTLTASQRADIEAYYGPCPTTVTLPHPVAPRTGGRRSWRSRLRGALKREQHVVVVSRLVPIKRIDHTVRAFAAVRSSCPRAHLEIWGSGLLADSLASLARELGIADHVHLRGHTDDPLGAFAAGQVSVTTSLCEGLGMTTIESLSVGTPVIAYDYRYGPRDLVRDRVTGWIVPNGDIDALAAAMRDALRHPWRTRLMGLAARSVRWTLSKRRHARRWAALVDAVARG